MSSPTHDGTSPISRTGSPRRRSPFGSGARPPAPRRDVPDLPDRLHEEVVLLEVRDPPRGPPHAERLPELRPLHDEPLVEGPDDPPGAQVDDPVRAAVRGRGDVLEEVGEALPGPADPAGPGPVHPFYLLNLLG